MRRNATPRVRVIPASSPASSPRHAPAQAKLEGRRTQFELDRENEVERYMEKTVELLMLRAVTYRYLPLPTVTYRCPSSCRWSC